MFIFQKQFNSALWSQISEIVAVKKGYSPRQGNMNKALSLSLSLSFSPFCVTGKSITFISLQEDLTGILISLLHNITELYKAF
jgi:hypothetical protein